MKLEWTQAPVKTQWGHDMVVASVAIDKDHTLDLYCELDQTQKVEAMLTQRTWVNATTWRGLTKKEVHDLFHPEFEVFHQRLEAKLKEKNKESLQRTWVGLTDEELREIIYKTGFGLLMNVWFDKHDGNPRKVLQALEAKLKEKNT